MKRILVSASVLLFFVLGCKDNNMIPDESNNISYLNSPSIISSVGTMHNNALNIMGADTTFSISDTAESVRLFTTSISNVVSQNSNFDSASIYDYGIDFANYLAGKNIDTILKAYYDTKFPTISNQLSAQEIDLVTRAMNFMYGYDFSSLTMAQACDLIIDKADSLLVEFNAIDWDTASSSSYMKGELAGGLLNVMKSSAQFWKENAPANTGTSDCMVVVLADAGGYVGGWIGAVVTELWNNGHLNINNQYNRIGVGVAAAVGTSTVGGILKFSKWFWK